MDRKRTSPVHKYFKFNILFGKSVCQIVSCEHALVGENAKNLERHTENFNYDIFAKYLSVESREIKRKNKCNELTSIQQKPITQSKLNFENKKQSISIELTANQFYSTCTELVTVNGRPFKLLEDSGFLKILNPLLKGLGDSCYVINKRNVRSNLIVKSNEVVANIKDSIKNKLLCFKMDCASRKDKSIIGINVQYAAAHTAVTTLHTLAMIELTQQHIAVYLKKKDVNEVLKMFEIKKQQITTDNARNFIKMVDLMHKENDELLEDNTNNNPTNKDLELDEN
ncbi:uncharacterized protein LOC113558160 [Rhopalosiphum maidis]|uniref:uncharacterized protein LOC113558160 n=1 Tax=Rhopalosiphum maidis TaxID=43146 RepID=UPI000EFEE91F|nr:uncharacterized protein LOC113558160 [Rhopalosiphum maidis]